MQRSQGVKFNEQEQLFISVADGVNNTLLQLAMLSEQAQALPAADRPEQWRAVNDVARSSLQLLEGYTLAMRLQGGTATPELEPLALSSLLYDTMQQLGPYAKQLAVPLELELPGKLQPVMCDKAILQSALLSLGQVFIAAHSQADDAPGQPLRLSAHRGRYGIVTGWYSNGLQLTASALLRARKLGGWAQQPYGELVSGPASGVFIAEGLLSAVAGTLHVARYHNATGLATTLPACRQLQLV